MAEPFIGEIKILPYTFTPYGYIICNGTQVVAQQYQALYAVLGNMYGGTPGQNFKVPNLLDKVPMHRGNGIGLTPRAIGETEGSDSVALNDIAYLPAHKHTVSNLEALPSDEDTPSATTYLAATAGGTKIYTTDISNLTPMSTSTLQVVGQNQPHSNIQPVLCLNFCIAWDGIFPIKP